MSYARPWESADNRAKKAEARSSAARSAKAKASRALKRDADLLLTADTAAVLAHEYVKHGDLGHALVACGYADEATTAPMIAKMIRQVRKSRRFAEAFDRIVYNFNEHEILTRDRILAGLYAEAADRWGPTTASARVAAWSKLAQLTGLEAAAKRTDDLQGELAAPGGVLMVPFVTSIEHWEQAAMTQQAQLKADVRN